MTDPHCHDQLRPCRAAPNSAARPSPHIVTPARPARKLGSHPFAPLWAPIEAAAHDRSEQQGSPDRLDPAGNWARFEVRPPTKLCPRFGAKCIPRGSSDQRVGRLGSSRRRARRPPRSAPLLHARLEVEGEHAGMMRLDARCVRSAYAARCARPQPWSVGSAGRRRPKEGCPRGPSAIRARSADPAARLSEHPASKDDVAGY